MSQTQSLSPFIDGIATKPVSTDSVNEEAAAESVGEASTSLSSKGEVTPFNGYDIADSLANGSPPIPVPGSRKKEIQYDQLLRSLPDFLEGSRPTPRASVSYRVQPVEPVNHPNVASKSNPLFSANWITKSRSKKQLRLQSPVYSIEYSVFRPLAQMRRIDTDLDLQRHLLDVLDKDNYCLEEGEWPENNIDADKFGAMVSAIVRDVENDPDLKPMRISQGSSGSYFILGKKIIDANDSVNYSYTIYKRGVFKPKDEEPYGPLSPKWSKWLHRTFFPCFFGRSCLIPNLGYISEAAACVLDRQLLLFIVPYTDIIHLKSDRFYYSFWERTRQKTAYKIGSFQCFLNGYVEANVFFKQYPFPHNLNSVPDDTFQLCHENDQQVPQFFWSKSLICQFQDELEKLVILDYIMRNTDRGADNWMIKVEWVELGFDGILKKLSARLRIGAIDSGLAFPWKHPDEWRSFPFGWLFLPYYIIGRPFSNKSREHYLPLLTSKYWWEQTTIKLKAVFQKDADFKERMWHKQIAVLKGQAFNVVEILKLQHAGPLELIRRENLMIWDDTMCVPSMVHNGSLNNAIESSIYDATSNLGSARRASVKYSETTPLLELTDKATASGPVKSMKRLPDDLSRSKQMSGFDYNMTFKDRESLYEEDEETNVKTVIIERLEKVYSKRPVFTWC